MTIDKQKIFEIIGGKRTQYVPEEDHFSAFELAESMGCGVGYARTILRQKIDAGEVEEMGRAKNGTGKRTYFRFIGEVD